MPEKRFGKLSPRYSLLINPYDGTKLSKCPRCDKPTFMRKFPLMIHVDGGGLIALRMTCRWCATCEIIMVQKSALENQLVITMERLKPEVIGRQYFVMGTMDLPLWKRAVREGGSGLNETLDSVADFKAHVNFDYDPGGWRPASPQPATKQVPPARKSRSKR